MANDNPPPKPDAPLVVALMCVLALMGVFLSIVIFSGMGLSHAVPLLKASHVEYPINCVQSTRFSTREMWIWLTVFGGVLFGMALLNCLCVRRDDSGDDQTPRVGCLSMLQQLFTTCWVLYGLYFVGSASTRARLESCDSNGTRVMWWICTLFVVQLLLMAFAAVFFNMSALSPADVQKLGGFPRAEEVEEEDGEDSEVPEAIVADDDDKQLNLA